MVETGIVTLTKTIVIYIVSSTVGKQIESLVFFSQAVQLFCFSCELYLTISLILILNSDSKSYHPWVLFSISYWD